MSSIQDGLLYEGVLQISILGIADFPSTDTLNFLNEKNENFLRSCLITRELAEVDEHDEVALELRRQDMKINLLLDMVSEILIHQKSLPEAKRIKLTSTGLECIGNEAGIQLGEKVSIDLFIMPAIAKPLNLFAEVVRADNTAVSLDFFGVNSVLQDWLEKVIFRHHRRAVAQASIQK
jgi:hypothetical protein